MIKAQPLTLSVEEAARLLGISRTLTYDLVRRAELPRLRLGRRVVIPRQALQDMIGGAGDAEPRDAGATR